MLYCVFNTDKEIIGRFKSHKKAIDYITDCNFNGIKTELKQMTEKEYINFMEKILKTS